MGKHSGPAPDPGRSRHTALLGLAVIATVLAWAVLVYFAIQIGSDVRHGNSNAWVLLAIAVVGAVSCLFLGLVLGARIVDEARATARAPHPTGGRRARR